MQNFGDIVFNDDELIVGPSVFLGDLYSQLADNDRFLHAGI